MRPLDVGTAAMCCLFATETTVQTNVATKTTTQRTVATKTTTQTSEAVVCVVNHNAVTTLLASALALTCRWWWAASATA